MNRECRRKIMFTFLNRASHGLAFFHAVGNETATEKLETSYRCKLPVLHTKHLQSRRYHWFGNPQPIKPQPRVKLHEFHY